MSTSPISEAWLRGPVAGIAPVLQPAAHALIQAQEDVEAFAKDLSVDDLWRERGAATPGFHLLHLAGALDRLFTYARGEALNDEQKTAARAEAVAHPELDATALVAHVRAAVAKAMDQLRSTDPATVLDARAVGRAGLPTTVLGALFHGAEHSARHAGQFISTVKLGR